MLRLRVMGVPSVERDGVPLSGRATQRRRLALLALLSVARERGVGRDRCIAFLWPDHDADRGRHSLSQLLYAVRQDLGPIVRSGIDQLWLDPAAIVSDVALFEEAVERDDLDGAVDAYGGVLLNGFSLGNGSEFDAWAAAERTRLGTLYADTLARLTRRAEVRADDVDAVRLWRLRAALDPLSPTVAAGLVGALARIGDSDGARQHVEEYTRRVRADLNLDPDPRVAAALTSTTPTGAERPVRGLNILWYAAGVLLVAASAGLAAWASRTTPSPTRAIVLAVQPGPDPDLDARVTTLLRGRLEREAGLETMPDTTVRRTLQEMRWPESSGINEESAIEVARRRGAVGAVLVRQAGLSGSGETLVEAFHPSAPFPKASYGFRSGSDGDLERGVAAAIERIVQLFADSRPGRSFPAITTASFEALEQYAMSREAYGRRDRGRARALARAAVEHDSSLAMAHYMLGELEWFSDHQRSSDSHMTVAYALSRDLPAQERIAIAARYQHLVEDRPDSALALWQQLRRVDPRNPLPLEGMVWAHRALGDWRAMAAAAETALQLGPPDSWPAIAHVFGDLETADDTGRVLGRVRRLGDPGGMADAIRIGAATRLGRIEFALDLLDSLYPPGTTSHALYVSASRHAMLLGLGRVAEARLELSKILATPVVQFPPRALIAQGRAEVSTPGLGAIAADRAREAVAWVRGADLSPPAIARIVERAADIAARAGDTLALRDFRAFLMAQDSGRQLRSYRLALTALDACDAYARGNHLLAARLARQAQQESYFGRSMATWLMLEADAELRAGRRDAAAALFRTILRGFVPRDGDEEALIVVRRDALRAVTGAAPPPTP